MGPQVLESSHLRRRAPGSPLGPRTETAVAANGSFLRMFFKLVFMIKDLLN